MDKERRQINSNQQNMIQENQQIITDSPNYPCGTIDNTYVEADGIYHDEGMVTEDSKKKKKTKELILD